MIVSPNLCEAKIASCSSAGVNVEESYGTFISGSDLEVALETEVTSEEMVEDLEPSTKLQLDTVQLKTPQLQQLSQRQEPQLQQQLLLLRLQQQFLPPDYLLENITEDIVDDVASTDLDALNDCDNFLFDSFNNDLESVSTLSICDNDEPMTLADDSDMANLLDHEEAADFDKVFDFCDEVLLTVENSILDNSALKYSTTINSALETVSTDTSLNSRSFNGTNSFPNNFLSYNLRLFTSKQPLQIQINHRSDSVSSSLTEGSPQTDGSCRKSARIAANKEKNLCRRRSDGISDDNNSEEVDKSDMESDIHKEIHRDSKYFSSFSSKTQDEDFILRRRNSFSKKRRRSNFIPNKLREDSDYLRKSKQEKNRLAARRCRLKQKLLFDNLTSEEASEQKRGEALTDEIDRLRIELKKLHDMTTLHDRQILPCRARHKCPVGVFSDTDYININRLEKELSL